jgi:hypothetical protein
VSIGTSGQFAAEMGKRWLTHLSAHVLRKFDGYSGTGSKTATRLSATFPRRADSYMIKTKLGIRELSSAEVTVCTGATVQEKLSQFGSHEAPSLASPKCVATQEHDNFVVVDALQAPESVLVCSDCASVSPCVSLLYEYAVSSGFADHISVFALLFPATYARLADMRIDNCTIGTVSTYTLLTALTHVPDLSAKDRLPTQTVGRRVCCGANHRPPI